MSIKKYRTNIIDQASVVIIDNYDSFTYNLLHLVNELTTITAIVVKNDKIDLSEIDQYSHIILSPGPELPEKAGLTKAIIKHYYQSKNILGVCLGHQAVFEFFGGKLLRLDNVRHGIQDDIFFVDNDFPLFYNLKSPFKAGRYHSWVCDEKTMPDMLLKTAEDSENQIMAIKHKTYPIYGVQFHPESYMTKVGKKILSNFLTH